MRNNQTILMTGASGFVGRSLLQSLQGKRTFKLIALDKRELLWGKGQNNYTFIKADLLDQRRLRGTITYTKPDILIHLAAVANRKDTERNRMKDIIAFSNVLKASQGVKKIILASSAAVYGNGSVPVEETQVLSPISHYGKSKATMERFLSSFCEEKAKRWVVLRIFNVFGEKTSGDLCNVVDIFLSEAMNGKCLKIHGSGEQTRDFVFIQDVVDAFYKTIESEVSGVFNVGSEKETSINELAALFEGAIERMGLKYEAGKPSGIARSFADTKKIKEKLGWRTSVNVKSWAQKRLEKFVKDEKTFRSITPNPHLSRGLGRAGEK